MAEGGRAEWHSALLLHVHPGETGATTEGFDVLGEQVLVTAGHVIVQGSFHVGQGHTPMQASSAPWRPY